MSATAAPEFVQRLNVFEEVEERGGLTFECQVRAFPRPVVKWFKDDVEIPSLSEEGRLTAEELPTDTGCSLLRLSIRDAHKDDEGAYRCKAENEEGVAATTGYLSVTGRDERESLAQSHAFLFVPNGSNPFLFPSQSR